MWQKIKILFIVVALVLLLIVTLQNTQPTEMKFLTQAYTITLPFAAALFLAAAVGFLMGALTTLYVVTRRRGPKTKA